MPTVLLASIGLVCLTAPGQLPGGAKWQYAELSYRSIPARPGGRTADGTEVPPRPASASARWVTAEGEVEAAGWAELADRLNLGGFKKDGSATLQRVRVLNHLGGQGWELVERGETAATATSTGVPRTWTFKRRVP